MGGKIRFRKNKGPYSFEMPIESPPPNDSYHPCVGLLDSKDKVELVLPGMVL